MHKTTHLSVYKIHRIMLIEVRVVKISMGENLGLLKKQI